MNFEFIKNLDVISCAYRYCANAEELVCAMPDNSMFAARKSAEALAKLIYRIAHDEEAGSLNFVDILSDPVVKKYIGDMSVINAFHFVRKKGNEAVHSLTEETADMALAVLKNLHFTFGEMAKKMGLITRYPAFNANIPRNPHAVPISIDDIDEVSRQMYVEYVKLQAKVDQIYADFHEMLSPVVFIPNYINTNDELIVPHRLNSKKAIVLIQQHYGTLGLLAIHSFRTQAMDQSEDNNAMQVEQFDVSLTLYGDHGYTTSNIFDFMQALKHDLPKADGFHLKCCYGGSNPRFDNRFGKFMELLIPEISQTEKLTYTQFEYYGGSGECNLVRWQDDHWIDMNTLYVDMKPDVDAGPWYELGGSLYIGYDYTNNPGLRTALQDVVRKHITDSSIDECETMWGDDSDDVFSLQCQLCVDHLSEIQEMIDDLNTTIAPYLAGCDMETSYKWFMTEPPFGVAELYCTEKGFGIA